MPTDFYTIEGGKAVHYRRTGECNRCGECCGIKHTITYEINASFGASSVDDDPERDWKEDDWSSWEGYTLIWAQRLWWYFKVTCVTEKEDPTPCKAQDQETKLCTVWNDIDEFPAICRYWPFRKSDLEKFPNCGYKFEEVADV